MGFFQLCALLIVITAFLHMPSSSNVARTMLFKIAIDKHHGDAQRNEAFKPMGEIKEDVEAKPEVRNAYKWSQGLELELPEMVVRN